MDKAKIKAAARKVRIAADPDYYSWSAQLLADCEPLLANISSVNERAAQETARAEIWLRETHADILENFDPTVVKLKKNIKVIVAPGVFDSLINRNESK